VALGFVGAEGSYLILFNAFVPAHVEPLAQARGLSLGITGLRSLYPGNIRMGPTILSDPHGSFFVTTQVLRGRFGLLAAFTGSLEFEWLVVEGLEVKIERPRALALLMKEQLRPRPPQSRRPFLAAAVWGWLSDCSRNDDASLAGGRGTSFAGPD